MRFKIKIIEISDDLKSKSNHDFDFKIKIVPISDTYIHCQIIHEKESLIS